MDPDDQRDGIQITEADGDFVGTVTKSLIKGNGKDGLKVEQGDDGAGNLTVTWSVIVANGDDPIDGDGIDVTVLSGH